jgi:membrane associated rhomboid family serine protease
MASIREPSQGPFLNVPLVLVALILVIVAAYIDYALAPFDRELVLLRQFAFIPARYSAEYLHAFHRDSGSLLDRAIPFVSYIFLHANVTHLTINMVWLLAFGAIVARRFGALPFLLFFLLCGIGGAVTHLAFNWGSDSPVVGASAAISGLMAAAFRMMSFTDRSLDSRPDLAPIFSQRILVWSAVWAVVNVVAGLTGLGAGPGVQLVAWQAHLGGYFTGLFLAYPFDRLSARAKGGLAG